MKTARKTLSIFLSAGLVLSSLLLTLFVQPVDAARLQTAKDTLNEPQASASTTHTFQFTVPSSGTLREIRFRFSTTASGTTMPTGTVLTGATLGTLVNMDGTWTIDTTEAASGILTVASGSGEDLSGNVVTIPLAGITNHGTLTTCDSDDSSSDTCFVQIQTSTAAGAWNASVIDSTVVTYTVVSGVTVSATVDPTMTFVISSVAADAVVGGLTTDTASTATTVPFGNIAANTVQYIAQNLQVTTNATSGYTVTVRMESPLTGTYSANNFDPFAGGSASWSSPQPWSTPNGTAANTDSGWIGVHTEDVAAFDDEEFAPLNATNNTVMSSTTTDDGTTTVNVLYAVEANVYQPADTYTGTINYTATPTY